jgi:hypothetical protein
MGWEQVGRRHGLQQQRRHTLRVQSLLRQGRQQQIKESLGHNLKLHQQQWRQNLMQRVSRHHLELCRRRQRGACEISRSRMSWQLATRSGQWTAW